MNTPLQSSASRAITSLCLSRHRGQGDSPSRVSFMTDMEISSPWTILRPSINSRSQHACPLGRLEGTTVNHRHGHAGNGLPPTDPRFIGPSRVYAAHRNMLQRCYNPKAQEYSRYGGRGVSVCERWRGEHGFVNFLADMGEPPDGKTLDRFPDRDGNYEPTNCRWASHAEQQRNLRNSKLTADLVQEIRGRFEHGENMTSVAVRLGVDRSTVSKVLSGDRWAKQ